MVPMAFAMLTFRLILQLIGFLRLCVYPNAVHIAIPELETVEKVAEEEIKAGLAGDTEGVVLPTVNKKGRLVDDRVSNRHRLDERPARHAVFLGVRVFAAAAIVGLLEQFILSDGMRGPVLSVRYRTRSRSITPSAFCRCLSSSGLSLTTLD